MRSKSRESLPKSVNRFLGICRNSAYSVLSSVLCNCKTSGLLVTIPATQDVGQSNDCLPRHQPSTIRLFSRSDNYQEDMHSSWTNRRRKQILKVTSRIIKETSLPEPRGRKSRPTMLSSTEDFPELCRQQWKCLLLCNQMRQLEVMANREQ